MRYNYNLKEEFEEKIRTLKKYDQGYYCHSQACMTRDNLCTDGPATSIPPAFIAAHVLATDPT